MTISDLMTAKSLAAGEADSALSQIEQIRDSLLKSYETDYANSHVLYEKLAALRGKDNGITNTGASYRQAFDDLFDYLMAKYQDTGEYYTIVTPFGNFQLIPRFIAAMQRYNIDIGTNDHYFSIATTTGTLDSVDIMSYSSSAEFWNTAGEKVTTSMDDLLEASAAGLADKLKLSNLCDAISNAWRGSVSHISGYTTDLISENSQMYSLLTQGLSSGFTSTLYPLLEDLDISDTLKSEIVLSAPQGLQSLVATISNYINSVKKEAQDVQSEGYELSSTNIDLGFFAGGIVLTTISAAITAVAFVISRLSFIASLIATAFSLGLQLVDTIYKQVDSTYKSTRFTVDSNGDKAFSFVIDQIDEIDCPNLYRYFIAQGAKCCSFKDPQAPIIHYIFVTGKDSATAGCKKLAGETHLLATYDITHMFRAAVTSNTLAEFPDKVYYNTMIEPNYDDARDFWSKYVYNYSSNRRKPMFWSNIPSMIVNNDGGTYGPAKGLVNGGNCGMFFRIYRSSDDKEYFPTPTAMMEEAFQGLDFDGLQVSQLLYSNETEQVLRVRLYSALWLLAYSRVYPTITWIAEGETGLTPNTYNFMGLYNGNAFVSSSNVQDWFHITDQNCVMQAEMTILNILPWLYIDELNTATDPYSKHVNYDQDCFYSVPELNTQRFDNILMIVAHLYDELHINNIRSITNTLTHEGRNDFLYGWQRIYENGGLVYTYQNNYHGSNPDPIYENSTTTPGSLNYEDNSGIYGARYLQAWVKHGDLWNYSFLNDPEGYSGPGWFKLTATYPVCFAVSLPTLTFSGYLKGLIADGLLVIGTIALSIGLVAARRALKIYSARKYTDAIAKWYNYQNAVNSGSEAAANTAWVDYKRARLSYNVTSLLTGGRLMGFTSEKLSPSDSFSMFNGIMTSVKDTKDKLANDISEVEFDDSAILSGISDLQESITG